MRSIAHDYGPQGVRANAICPGWVTTPMADEEMIPLIQEQGLSLTEAYQRVCRDVPLRQHRGDSPGLSVSLLAASRHHQRRDAGRRWRFQHS